MIHRPRPRVPGSSNALVKRSEQDPIMDRLRYVTPPSLAQGSDKAHSKMAQTMRSTAAQKMKKKGDQSEG